MKGPALFQGEIIKNEKIFSSRTTGPISTKHGTKHPWVKGSQVCSNEGPCPFPRGDKNEIAKVIDEIKKYSSPEPLSQFQPNMAQCIFG